MSQPESHLWEMSIQAWALIFLLSVLKAIQVSQGHLVTGHDSIASNVLLVTAIYWVIAGLISLCALIRLRELGLINDLPLDEFRASMAFSVPMGILALLYTFDQMQDRCFCKPDGAPR